MSLADHSPSIGRCQHVCKTSSIQYLSQCPAVLCRPDRQGRFLNKFYECQAGLALPYAKVKLFDLGMYRALNLINVWCEPGEPEWADYESTLQFRCFDRGSISRRSRFPDGDFSGHRAHRGQAGVRGFSWSSTYLGPDRGHRDSHTRRRLHRRSGSVAGQHSDGHRALAGEFDRASAADQRSFRASPSRDYPGHPRVRRRCQARRGGIAGSAVSTTAHFARHSYGSGAAAGRCDQSCPKALRPGDRPTGDVLAVG